MLGFGAVVASLVWLGRILTRSIPLLLFLDVADQITSGMTGIPLTAWAYEKAIDGRSRAKAVLFREIALFCGSFLAALILIVLVLLNLRFEYSFVFAAAFSLFPLFAPLRITNDRR